MKHFFSVLLCCFFVHVFIFAANDDKNIKTHISKMSIEEKAAQVLMMSIEGKKTFPVYLNSYFSPYSPGAFILFGFNFSDTPQESAAYIKSVKQSIQKLSKTKVFIPPFFASDFEGGWVYRIKNIASPLPSPKEIAETFNEEDALSLYEQTAKQISLLGIHLNLAPIVEKIQEKNESFFDNRIFSSDEDVLVKYSQIFISGMEKGGVISTVKHFPGTASDPHLSKSIIDDSEDIFYKEFIRPFKRVIYDTDGVVLISHAEVSFIEKVPFCFSKIGIEKFLRNELKFKGMILTDDMAMKALKTDGRSTADNVISALSAGCDMVMCSEPKFKELVNVISNKIKQDADFANRIDDAVYNILKIKIKMGIIDELCMPIEKNKFDKEKFYKAKKAAEDILKKQKSSR
ncbi:MULTISPECIES: glycoside hydrolase family 3 N-terminal domain-containing protein [unclassified Treponema]|uniref:glycoside hydrolase family 3 N-terminal domain-containing protein n=1 Tax=unclassified Treponema TaxID=2638727 RepID=UPI0020A5C79B|nr:MULTISPECIES: glycoside hydrolase family 3 N-terminal domain-containing protein [unclassified Treponema]UTC65868.1 glycoside hydrolase family 3 protein [Treponema sp. OMZ 789]UTC68596.1 glycoside hydrolase family 3 protein [Treponema sp. OMZ 790]UTC71326.1 glycoside hydrolase family 3 protein [Treponema sp. OMZ 791]